jgi:membrane protein involved in colicin uptake
MARKSLRPHLNQIRSWVRQGRTDAWIAHQLEVSGQEIAEFKRQNALDESEAGEAGGEPTEDFDMRAEDDALIAAELEAAALEAEREKAAKEEKAKAAAEKRAKAAAERRAKAAQEESDEDGDSGEDEDEDEAPARRRRGRRGGRGRKSGAREGAALEGTFDHGEEGYGLWLDPAIQDDPIYAEHWAGHRPIEVKVQEDQIVIRRIREDT